MPCRSPPVSVAAGPLEWARVQIIRSRRLFDICIVGSAAGGGMAAKVLTEAGADLTPRLCPTLPFVLDGGRSEERRVGKECRL